MKTIEEFGVPPSGGKQRLPEGGTPYKMKVWYEHT